MSAIRLARGYTGRNKIIKFVAATTAMSTHCWSKQALPLTLGGPNSAGIPASFAAETIIIDYNDAEGVSEAFAKSGNDIAAIIVEPYPANCGMILPDTGYLELLRKLCTGNPTYIRQSHDRFSSLPVACKSASALHLTALGKIIGGGLPVGAFGGKAEIADYLASDQSIKRAPKCNPLHGCRHGIEKARRSNPPALSRKWARRSATPTGNCSRKRLSTQV